MSRRTPEPPAPAPASYRWLAAAALAAVLPAVGLAQTGGPDVDTVRAGRFDTGKMWTFEYPPGAYFSETYGFDADSAWFERARMAALRIPGCSASFVSPNGLLATNHHCVRGAVSRVSRPGETLLDDGFYASSLDGERRISNYYADQLIAVQDVSDAIFAATDQAPDETGRERARSEAFGVIERRLRDRYAASGDSIWVQLIGLYHGGRYSAYVFRRFTDIRLVAAVELQTGFFGGDPDNFTYPRYALDFAFLRVYGGNGEPYHPRQYFGWGGQQGVQPGDVVFVIGNPGPTNRLATVAQLELQRDVTLPATLHVFDSRLHAMDAYRTAFPEEAEHIDIRNRMFGLSNSLKATIGRLDALETPVIMARRADAEQALHEAIQGRDDLRGQYGQVFARLADLQRERRALGPQYGAFRLLGNGTYGPQTLRRAIVADAYLAARTAGDAERATRLREALVEIEDLPADLERRFLEEQLADFRRFLGPDHDITKTALRGMAPGDAAVALLRASPFATAAGTRRASDGNRLDVEDPALRLGAVLGPYLDEYRAAWERLDRAENALAEDLGRARFDVSGTAIAPDATFSPRITDGVVRGYEYNGTLAPPYTTFYGLYDRFASHPHPSDWDLAPRWRRPPPGLDLATPLNFVSTADTYGGNSGSPAVTKDLLLVGLNFDRNIEGLSRDFIYLPERGRNVMVDVRAIHAALDHVYDADRVVQELLTGRLYRTEAEADRATGR